MAMPLFSPLVNVVREDFRAGAERAATATLTWGLALVSVALLVAAGLVWLTSEIGFVLAALVFAGGFALLALYAQLWGRARAAHRSAQSAARRSRAAAEVAALAALARSARPLMPVAAFLAAFALAPRR